MVDNVQIDKMSGGDVIAADDVAGVKYQRVKIGHGTDGAYADAAETTPLPVAAQVGGSIGSVRTDVPVAGTAAQLPAQPGIIGATVRANPGNTGAIYIGGIGVTAANGVPLLAGEAFNIDITNTDAIYVNADIDGDGVSCLWVKP